MEKNRQLFSVYKTEADKNTIIINNVVLMLSNRIYIDANKDKHQLLNYESTIKKIIDKGDNAYTVKADNGDIYAIKIIYQKVMSTGKQSVVSGFIEEYSDNKKIIIANDFNNKTIDFVTKNGSQIFKEGFMLRDIVSHNDQPMFELLSPNEMEEVKKEYNITPQTAPKMMRSDPIVKYYGLKKGDFVRVIEPSPTSGLIVTYEVIS